MTPLVPIGKTARRAALAAAALWALSTLPPSAAALPIAAADSLSGARVRVPPGSELRDRPSWDARVVAVLPGGELPLAGLGLGDWVEVESAGAAGWVELGDPRGWPSTAATTLARARRRLGDAAAVERRLGPFAAASDLDARRTWAFFERLAANVPTVYAERYALPTELADALDRETVVILEREEDYRELALAGRDRAGHAGEGFAMLYLGRRSRHEAGTTLVHELTHLLNRRALGAELPPWLDEGLAEDMALAPIAPSGRLDAAPLGLRSLRTPGGKRLYGPLLHLPALAGRAAGGELPGLAELTALDRAAFENSPDREALYALFGCWARYLVEDAELGPGFRRYLAARARQPAATGPPRLRDHLGRDWPQLDAGFSRWLLGLASRLELEPGPVAGP